MNLEEFVAETLQQKMRGVTTAKRADSRVAVERKITMTGIPGVSNITSSPPIHMVEFDVAVTVSDKLEGELKGHLAVVGGKAANVYEKGTANRVKFSVPLDLTAELRETGLS